MSAISDKLGLANQPKLSSQLGSKQQIYYSCSGFKLSENNQSEERILLLTSEAFYIILLKEGKLRALAKKIMPMQNSYDIRRTIPFNNILAITTSRNAESTEILVHIATDYDLRCSTPHKTSLLIAITTHYWNLYQKKLPFFLKDESVLLPYCLTKSKCKDNGKSTLKHRTSPMFLCSEDLSNTEFSQLKYKLVYSDCKQGIGMDQLEVVYEQTFDSKRSNYVLQTVCRDPEEVKSALNSKEHFLHLPTHIFSTKEKLHLLWPFMHGGTLAQHHKFNVHQCTFFMGQMVLMLEELHQSRVLYRNFCLENLYIDSCGYLKLDGLEKLMTHLDKEQQLFSICGKPYYMAPEMLLHKGYTQQLDIWQFGVCAYKMYYGFYPFLGTNAKEVFHHIVRKQPMTNGDRIEKTLQKMLLKDPRDRITLNKLKKEDMFAQISWQSLTNKTIKSPYMPTIQQWKGPWPQVLSKI